MDIKIQLADSEIDLASEIGFGLNYSIDDIRNVEKKNTNYSKTITLAGSDNNNKILGGLFDVNSDFTYFNPNIKTPAKIIVNSETVIEGFLQLKSIETNGDIKYKCVINSNAVDFFTDIKDKKLSDLDFNDYNHAYNSASITESWNGTKKYVYPLLYKGAFDYGIRDFKPAIFHKEYVKRIALEAGYSLGGGLMDATTEAGGHYAKEIIPFNGEVVPISNIELERRLFEVTSSGVPTVFSETLGTTMSRTSTKLEILDNEVFDNGNLYNNYTYTVDKNGTYALQFRFTGQTTVSTNGIDAYQSEYKNTSLPITSTRDFATNYEYIVKFDIVVNNVTIISSQKRLTLPNVLNAANGYTDRSLFELDVNTPIKTFNAGDNVEVRYSVLDIGNNVFADLNYTEESVGVNNLTSVPTTFSLKGLTGSFLKNTTGSAELTDGDTLVLNDFIPKEVKQSDLITDLVKRYNIYLSVDPNNDRKILIDTREQYFAKGGVLDWSDKQDMDSKVDIKLISELQNKEFLFTYKEGKDEFNEAYSNRNSNVIYGQKDIEFQNDFVKGQKKIRTPFSPTPLIPAREGKNFAIVSAIKTVEPNTNIRVLYYGGLINCLNGYSWNLIHSGGTDNYANYPYAGHLDNPINPTIDINFGEIPTSYYSEFESRTNSNLYNRFWKNYLEQLANGKLVTMNMYLNSTDIGFIRHNLNTKIYVGNSYYYINKIVDYNPLNDELTKVEFLKINEGVSFVGDSNPKGIGELTDKLEKTKDENNQNDGQETSIDGFGNYISGLSMTAKVIGDNNIVDGSKGIISGDRNRVLEGVEKFFVIGSNDKEIIESNTGYIGDVFFKNGKIDKSSNSDSIANLKTKELVEGEIYYATDKGYYLQALTKDTLATKGFITVKCVILGYYATIEVYKEGETYSTNDLVVYGNRVWKLTGSDATPVNFYTLSSGWTEQTDTYYEDKILNCNFANDLTSVTQVSDNRGNVVINDTYGGFLYSDWNASNISNNVCWGFMNNLFAFGGEIAGNNCKLIANNIITNITNNKNNGDIVKNKINTDGDIDIKNNVNNGDIGNLTSVTLRGSDVQDTIVNK